MMTFCKKVLIYLVAARLYILAITLFCGVLLLIEMTGLLPKRMAVPATTDVLKPVGTARLNVSQTTEYTAVVSGSPTSSTSIATINLSAHEKDALSIGDILFAPGIGYGVVTAKRYKDDSIIEAVEFDVSLASNAPFSIDQQIILVR